MFKISFRLSSLLGKNIKGRGREYHGCNEEYNGGGGKERGSNFICPFIFSLFGRISSGEEGKATEIMGNKIKI